MKGAVTALFFIIPSIAFCAEGAPQEFSFFSSFLQMLAALAIVLGLVFVTWHFSAKFMKGLPVGQQLTSRHIRLIETRYFGPKRSLLLVEVSGQYLLIANTDQGIQLIKEIDMLEEIEIIEEQQESGGFAAILARLRKTA